MQSISSKCSQNKSVHLQQTGQQQRGDRRAALCRSTNLGEGGGRHLYSAFIGGVDLQVVPVGAVQPQQPAAWEASVVTCGMTTTMMMTTTHTHTHTQI